MKIILFVLFSALSFSQRSSACVTLANQATDVVLTWTAFKTPAKAGVNGTFKKIKINQPSSAKSIGELMSQTSFEIDTSSVSTKDPSRDKKIAKNFFNFSNKSKIVGKFISMKNKVLTTELTINGVTKKVPMALTLNDKQKTFIATGHIDVFDFLLNDQLAALNKVCYQLHKGKTWSDVALKLEAQFSACPKK